MIFKVPSNPNHSMVMIGISVKLWSRSSLLISVWTDSSKRFFFSNWFSIDLTQWEIKTC